MNNQLAPTAESLCKNCRTITEPREPEMDQESHVDAPEDLLVEEKTLFAMDFCFKLDMSRPLNPQVIVETGEDWEDIIFWDEDQIRLVAEWFQQAVGHINTRARL
jgi:hypothetical protein